MSQEVIARLRALPLPDAKTSETAQLEATAALRSIASALASSKSAPWSATSRKAVWDVACSIWNVCVVATNAGKQTPVVAHLRRVASELVHAAGCDPASNAEGLFSSLLFATKAGEAFSALGQPEAAESLYVVAASDADALLALPGCGARELDLIVTAFAARARCASALSQPALASGMLERAARAASDERFPPAEAIPALECAVGAFIDLGRLMVVSDDAAGAAPLLLRACGLCAAGRAVKATDAAGGFDPILSFRALQLCTIAQLRSEGFDQALNCARALASESAAEAERADSPCRAEAASLAKTAQFLVVQSLLGIPQRAAEAAEALIEAATRVSGAASADMLLESISQCAKSGAYAAAGAAVLAMVRAMPERGDAVVRLMELCPLNDPSARSAVLTLLAADAALAALRGAAAAEARTATGPLTARKRLSHALALIWNAASSLFEAKQYAPARELFSTVLTLHLPSDPARVRAARAACLCLLALREPEGAQRYIELATKIEGEETSVQTQFLRLKCSLELSGDDDAALAVLNSFSSCPDMQPEFLLLAALEAQSKHALRASQTAYSLLFADAATPGSATAQHAAKTPGYVGQLLRHLVKVTTAKWDAADTAAAAAGAPAEAGRLKELSQMFLVAAERLDALDVSGFAGADPAAASTELRWFAAAAWNAGRSAGTEPGGSPDWAAAARLFAAAGSFAAAQGSAPPPDVPVHLAFLLSAAAWLEVHAASGETADLEHAQSALGRHAALISIMESPPQGAAAMYALMVSFSAACRAKEDANSLALLRSAEALPSLSVDNALKLAFLSSGGSHTVCERAHSLCLRVMQRSSGVPPASLSYILRKTLILQEGGSGSAAGGTGGGGGGADSREARLLRSWREAGSLLAGVPHGGYPADEAAWLVSTCWNRGAMLSKLGKPDVGESYLKAALELLKHAAKHAPGIDAHKAAMLDSLAQLTRKRASAAESRPAAEVVVID